MAACPKEPVLHHRQKPEGRAWDFRRRHCSRNTEACTISRRGCAIPQKQKAPTTKAAFQEQVELDEEDPAPTRTRNRRGEPLTPPPTSESASKAAFRTSPRSTASTWPMFWQRMAITYKESKWVAGVSNVLTHMITHNGVDDVVKLANKLYETRDIVALNNATKTKTQLRYSKDEAQSVAVQYKALWEAMESSALSKCMILLANRNLGQALRDLERQLDQIDDDSGQQQLGDFARLYLENRSQGTRLRDTPETLHSLLNTTSKYSDTANRASFQPTKSRPRRDS